ncbi:hypothetical protein NE848_08290 [Gramella jeungdoensis]|uniref:Ferritin-like domain-containing protein n=1 Tax=Gramella jeungdoensis TaxID=708091 RepID=A0ABT0Z0Z2_9FLAO|nr:hypothetical protein [Gramella jeungdoensis]MCM8569375.1 hypothetical protein [Gramella jeungdoensis]
MKLNLENFNEDGLYKVVMMVLPMVKEKLEGEIESIKEHGLPFKEDALRDIGECIPFESTIIREALLIQSPLQLFEKSIKKLKDQLEIIQFELNDLKELQRLELFREGVNVKQLQTEKERQQQTHEILQLTERFEQLREELKQTKALNKSEKKKLQSKIHSELALIEPKLLSELKETLDLIDRTLQLKELPSSDIDRSIIKDLILQRQLRALKDIANHALVVEQSAIAPLTMGIIHYKRYREIQEAMTTFIRDEAKHSATFRRYLVEKLEAKEYISAKLIKGANRYMWLARFMPATGMFLAVIVEIIGAAYLEFFANEKYMPEKLFCSICTTISTQDEKRHIDLCVAMYNELFRKTGNWERIRNKMALKKIMKSVYGDKDENHHLIQAFRAFGVESDVLYNHIIGQLSTKLARIGLYIKPQEILEMMLGDKAKQIKFDT